MREHIMGTQVFLAGLVPSDAATVFAWLRRVERTFSRFLGDSDTGRVNGGGAVEVSELFLVALAEAVRHQEGTGGLFSPWLAADMARIGYTPADPRAAVARTSGQPQAEIDFDRRTVRLRGGLGVDLGGFVKGWSVQRAADALRSQGVGRGLIDAGGDLACWRSPSDPPWRIGVEHPLGGTPVATLEPPAGLTAVATSSVVRRSWDDEGGRRMHHLIDPRTGLPSASDCLQATVVTADLASAEVYAKCVVILGTAAGPAWLASRDPSARWITVDRDGTATEGGP
ncbi:FAD:protein FMN transferase [Nonomuraea sp. NPDC046802]|uniref:FAD:protein FMN transferase n=1 Tax=Nonomuraea sp. NPDC046802 TaxID=3154919 RepID=UPI0033D38591